MKRLTKLMIMVAVLTGASAQSAELCFNETKEDLNITILGAGLVELLNKDLTCTVFGKYTSTGIQRINGAGYCVGEPMRMDNGEDCTLTIHFAYNLASKERTEENGKIHFREVSATRNGNKPEWEGKTRAGKSCTYPGYDTFTDYTPNLKIKGRAYTDKGNNPHIQLDVKYVPSTIGFSSPEPIIENADVFLNQCDK